jgi:adenosine deaminase
MATAPPPDFPGGERLWRYVRSAPKAELHLHIEGTLEPELMFQIAARNGITLEGTVESHRKRRENFKDLQGFLDLYYAACDVLRTEEDFRDLMYTYLRRASVDNVCVAEIFFDPQTHTDHGVLFDVVVSGLYRGILESHRDFEIRASLIMCFLRHLTEKAALATLDQARPHLDKIIGVGLDSGELGNPPSKFRRVFEKAARLGLKLVAHAGEEAGPEYIREALDVLHVRRVDHGVQCLNDGALVDQLVKEGVPLTTCTLSNIKLQVNSRFFDGRDVTGELLGAGLKVTINSDDPAYFGGYVNDNFVRAIADCGLTEKDVYQVCRNSFTSSFLSDIDKAFFISQLDYHTVISGYAAPPRSISIFGSRSPEPSSPKYEEARAMAKLLASRGFTVITGGYSGIMKAGAHGAKEGLDERRQSVGGEESVGQEVCGVLVPSIFIQRESLGNCYLTHPVIARSLTGRLNHFCMRSEYFLVCKGTIGTIAELLFVWKYATVRKMLDLAPPKIFIVRSKFEKPLETFVEAMNVFPQDRGLVQYVDTAEEVLQAIEEDLKQRTGSATITLPPC